MAEKYIKKRLSNFLAYEWILVVVAVLAAIFVLELVYGFVAVKPTVGQKFNYYYDENVTGNNVVEFKEKVLAVDEGKNGKTFSYDVLTVSQESLVANFNVLNARLELKEADIMITDCHEKQGEEVIRAKQLINAYNFYRLEDLLKDAKDYLGAFFESGYTPTFLKADKQDIVSHLDNGKIDAHFLERMKGDNRFRTDAQKEDGKLLERVRIKKLTEEVCDFNYLMSLSNDGVHNGLFYTHAKKDVDQEEKIYGIRLEKLDDFSSQGKVSVSRYFKLNNTIGGGCKDLVMMAFDFKADQPDLQYETISFMNSLIRYCSVLLD